MKVALISFYCLDSTLPLAKHLADENNEIHVFGMVSQYNQNAFVVDFTSNRQPNGFIKSNILSKKIGKHLRGYLSGLRTNFFIFPAGIRFRNLFPDIWYAWQFSRYLKKEKFDIIHLIHTGNRFSLLILDFLKNQRIIQTLHEVTGHSGDTNRNAVRLMKKLIDKNIPVIFHSYISKERFFDFRSSVTTKPLDEKLYTMIRFGLYETYKLNACDENCVQQKDNASIPIILYFGRIAPYKGIDILIDAIRLIQKKQPVHLIVAGVGTPYFSFNGINSYEFRHYAISNDEIIDLIKNCTMVVCPYRSASQSGIPMTVFAFKKPIVASNMEGFKGIIEHNITGLIVDEITATSFANSIEQLVRDKALRQSIANNITEKFSAGEFSWSSIAKETLDFYGRV
jgi:glycosyltransferase involved in cell wall biosynthesis